MKSFVKKTISVILCGVMLCTAGIAASAAEVSQPFAAGTANSDYYRIPAIVTLSDGRLVASADIRYGNGTDSPANIDTGVRYSDDNGATWSDVNVVNHFSDVVDVSSTNRGEFSASFIDSALAVDSQGRLYLVCDALPAFLGSPQAGDCAGGFIDGKMAVCDKTTETTYESKKLNKDNYPYYVGDFEDGFAPICRFSDDSVYENYYVDTEYNLYISDGEYLPVRISKLDENGKVINEGVQANLFYAQSPVKVSPAFYSWMRTSDDGGETWSDPVILNTMINSRGFTGFGPGRGFACEVNGKERVFFTVYDNNNGKEYASVLYSDDRGVTWNRSVKASNVGAAGKSSESQLVLLNNGVIRMYSRNTAKYIGYCDSTDGGESWGEYTLDKSLGYCSNCMVSFINYSQTVDGQKAIIASFPSKATRKLGAVMIGLVDENNNVDWAYRYNVTDSIAKYSFVYSCLTELADGRIADLYESDAAEITFAVYDIDTLKTHDKAMGFFEYIAAIFHYVIDWFNGLFK